jgi:hypothetical protein
MLLHFLSEKSKKFESSSKNNFNNQHTESNNSILLSPIIVPSQNDISKQVSSYFL